MERINLQKYTKEWIENLNPLEWETEREIVRKLFCNSKSLDFSSQIKLQNILKLFDKIKREK